MLFCKALYNRFGDNLCIVELSKNFVKRMHQIYTRFKGIIILDHRQVSNIRRTLVGN